MAVVHQLKEVTGRRGRVVATVACGAQPITARCLADVFSEVTAWHSFTTCPDCLALEGRCRPAAN